MEYELSFLNFDYKEIIKNLKKIGGKKNHSMILFKMVTKAVNNKHFMETNKSHRNSKAIKS